jgi:hypothetical protein
MLLSDGTELTYRVRPHARARHVRIVVSRRAGVVVTIPRGFDRQRIPGILEQKRDWLEEMLCRFPLTPFRPPERIMLPSIAEEWTVAYEAENAQRVTLRGLGERRLHVSGAINRPELVRTVLGKWLVIKARQHLITWLRRVAAELGISVSEVSVRLQRSIWGSCSRRDAISLNARLLLIPPDLVRYVFIHELMHTRHRNHSPAFWQAVAAHVPDYRNKLKELKRFWNALEI